jgi:hypothetical protein
MFAMIIDFDSLAEWELKGWKYFGKVKPYGMKRFAIWIKKDIETSKE